MSDGAVRPPSPDIPVTVLAGYLGAGKTTLLNRVLADADGSERIAVLVNDFGDINVDESLIEQADDDVISLANGCICCSLADGLVAALDQVSSLEVPPDRLIIEASGVSDPSMVAAHAMTPGFRLDGVVVAADASRIERLLTDRYVAQTVATQLDRADLIALTKVDLVPDAAVDELLARLAATHTAAVVVPVESGAAPVGALFGLAVSPAVAVSPAAAVSRGEAGPEEESPHGHGHEHDAADRFVTASWEGGLVSAEALDTLLADRPVGLVRAKGFVETDDGRFEVQLVGERVDVRPSPDRSQDGLGAASVMVAIGIRAQAPDLESWLAHLDP